jgi:hypothetical protein
LDKNTVVVRWEVTNELARPIRFTAVDDDLVQSGEFVD